MLLFLFFFLSLFDDLILDEELPFLTPYDVFLNEKDVKLETNHKPSPNKSTAMQSIVQPTQTERNFSYEISDEKLLTAAAQLVDVYNKRSKASAAISVQKKQTSEPRVRLNQSQRSARPPFQLPNFVVTKITEKTRSTPPDKIIAVKPMQISHGLNPKTIRQPDEIDQTKRMIEMQRQKTMHAYNSNASKNEEARQSARQSAQAKTNRIDAREFQMKQLNKSNQGAHSNCAERMKPVTIKQDCNKQSSNEPVILNFRTKMHDTTPKTRPIEPMTLNGKLNANAYRVHEISPHSKNSMGKGMMSTKSTDRYYANKLYQSSIARSVRPVSMPVTKNYSRFPNNSARMQYQNRSFIRRSRAPIMRKCPSMPDLSKIDKMPINFLGQNQTNEPAAHETSRKLTRYKSCFIVGTKASANLFDYTIKSNHEYSKLYNLCSEVVSKLSFKGQVMRRKRGRPKKKIYKSITKDLLNSPEFSLRADILQLNDLYRASKRFNANPRRSKRFALLSIEPVLPEIETLIRKNRDRSPVSTFQTNRTPLKTYSRVNMIQPRNKCENRSHTTSTFTDKPQIQLLNIEPMSSTSSASQIDLERSINEEVTQSTEYIIDAGFINEDFEDAVYIEYLEDNDEIESPAFEPHLAVNENENDTISSSIITEEADTTFGSCSQYPNWEQMMTKKTLHITHSYNAGDTKRNQHIEVKYLGANESDAHSTTGSIAELFAVCETDDTIEYVLPDQVEKKLNMNLSPVRKSTRKRKIPSQFPNFAKKIRG